MMSSRVVKESVWAILGQCAAAGVGLLSIRILTEMAPAGAFGKANLLLGLLTLGLTGAVSPTLNAQLRFYPDYKNRGKALAFLRVIKRRTLVGILVVMAALVIGLPFAAPIIGVRVDTAEVVILSLTAVGLGLKGIEINRLNSEREQAAQSVWSGVEPAAVLCFSVVALAVSATAVSLLIGQLLGVSVMVLVFLVREGGWRDSGRTLPIVEARQLGRELFGYGVPFVAMAALSWMGNLGDRYVLGTVLGTASVGIYAASFGLASKPILLVSGVVNQVLRPVLFEATSAQQERKQRRVTAYWLLIVGTCGFGGAALFAIFGDTIAGIFLARSFRFGARSILAWVAFGYAFSTLAQAIENQLMARYRPGRLILPQLVGGLANLALALYLIPICGVVGAAQANMGSFAIQFVVTLVMWLCLGNGPPVRKSVVLEGGTPNDGDSGRGTTLPECA